MQWIIIAIIAIIAIWSTNNLKLRPNKKQVVVEYIYNILKNVVTANMGEEFLDVIPFIGTFISILNNYEFNRFIWATNSNQKF